jgi:hypothetical protein
MTGSTPCASQQYASERSIVCPICAEPVPLETSKTDECGKGVHEECYVSRIISRFRTAAALQLPENWFSSIIVRFQRGLRVVDNC